MFFRLFSRCFEWVPGGKWIRLGSVFLSLFDLGLVVFNRSGLCRADMVVIHCTSCVMLKKLDCLK